MITYERFTFEMVKGKFGKGEISVLGEVPKYF